MGTCWCGAANAVATTAENFDQRYRQVFSGQPRESQKQASHNHAGEIGTWRFLRAFASPSPTFSLSVKIPPTENRSN
jgi:hypothetical protein